MRSLKKSGTDYPVTSRHIPEQRNSQQCHVTFNKNGKTFSNMLCGSH